MKTKALISFAVTAKLVCAFVFTYANCWISHAAAHRNVAETTRTQSKFPFFVIKLIRERNLMSEDA